MSNRSFGFPEPPPQPDAADDKRLTENEVMMTLRTTLHPEHYKDPNVMKWIQVYMNCRDERQAARAAGLDPSAGRVFKRRADIQLAIQRLTEKSLMKHGYDASEVIERVKEMAFIDPIELENNDGTFKKLRDIEPEARRAIKSLTVKNVWETDPNGMKIWKGEIIEYKFFDKLKAAELLGREKSVFKETIKTEHDVGDNMAALLLESKERAAVRMREVRERYLAAGAVEVIEHKESEDE